MRKVLRIISRVDGAATNFDNQFVKRYDPTYHRPLGSYDGGILETTPNIVEALTFADAAAALEKWRQPSDCQCHGTRPWDGKPNRPLTAFHCAVENAGSVTFLPSGRGKAQCPSNPEYPNGVALDMSEGKPSAA